MKFVIIVSCNRSGRTSGQRIHREDALAISTFGCYVIIRSRSVKIVVSLVFLAPVIEPFSIEKNVVVRIESAIFLTDNLNGIFLRIGRVRRAVLQRNHSSATTVDLDFSWINR